MQEEFEKKFPENSEIYEGLIGIVASKSRPHKHSALTSQIFYDIRMLLKGRKDEEVKLKPKNDKEYALYLMTKHCNINPLWMLLMTQDISAWNYL